MKFLRRPFQFIPALGPPKATSRQRTLAAWRGADAAPLEKAAQPTAKSSAQLIPELLRTLRWEQRRGEAEIVRVWNHLLPPEIVQHAQPTGLHKGTLFVRVDSSPWLDEIVRWRRKEILDRLQHAFGRELIARISFRLG